MNMRWLVLLSFLTSGMADAGVGTAINSFVPANPTVSDVVRLRTDSTGCYEVIFHGVEITAEPAIEVRFESPDTICDTSNPDNFITPRFISIGNLPAGQYVTRIFSCSNTPMGFTCEVVQQGSLTVTQANRPPSTVPTISLGGLLGLGVAIFLIAASRSRPGST